MTITPSFTVLLGLLAIWGAVTWALGRRREARRLGELIARAEHELRAPVAVLRLTCDRMAREPAGRRYARSLEVEVERLAAGLADLSAARTRRRSPGGRGAGDLREFAGGALAGWAPALRAAGRRTRVDWKAGEVEIPGDRGHVAQALGNLVANAAEHGTGEVELRGRRVPGGVRVEVRNRVPTERSDNAAAARPAGSCARSSCADRPSTRGFSSARRAFERLSFVGRLVGRGRRPTRGRGLAIAADAAAELGGSIETREDGRTFVAALELPLSDASIRMRKRLGEQGEYRRARPRRPRTSGVIPAAPRPKGPARPPGVPPGGLPSPHDRPPAHESRPPTGSAPAQAPASATSGAPARPKHPTRPKAPSPKGPRPFPATKPPRVARPPRVNRPPVPPPRRNTNGRRM